MRKRRVIKSKRKTVLRISMLFGILLLIIAGAIATVLLLRQTASPQAQLNALAFTAADNYIFTGSGFLYTHDGTLYNDDLYNDKNDNAWQIGDGTFSLAASPTIQLIYNDAEFQIIGENFPKETTGTLRSVKCGAAFIAALRADTGDVEHERIQVYDHTGTTLDQMGGDQFIMDYGFFEADNEYLYVVSMSLAGATTVSTITIYNVSRISTSGVMPVQNQLIEHMRFTKAGIFAIGTNQIIRYSLSDSRESYRVMVYGWKLMDYNASGANPAFLLRPRNGNTLGTVKLLTLGDGNVPNETQYMLQMPAGTLDAFLMNGKLIAVTSGGYVQYDLTGKQTGSYTFAVAVEEAKKLDDTTLLLRQGSAYYTAKIA